VDEDNRGRLVAKTIYYLSENCLFSGDGFNMKINYQINCYIEIINVDHENILYNKLWFGKHIWVFPGENDTSTTFEPNHEAAEPL
jgi:hypothetical protein